MAKDTRLYIRIDEEMKRKLQQLADKDNRTLSNYVLTILQNHIKENKEDLGMNKTVKKAMEIMEGTYKQDLPDVNIGDTVRLGDIWDGNGDVPTESYSYQISEAEWINYEFEVIEENEDTLDTVVKITDIELL